MCSSDLEPVGYQGLTSLHESCNLQARASFNVLAVHDTVPFERCSSELRILGGLTKRCGVLAVEVCVVPAFGMAGQSESWKVQRRRAAPLDRNTPIRTQGVALFVLGIAVEGFKK